MAEQTHLREVNQQRKTSIARRTEGASSDAQQSAPKIWLRSRSANPRKAPDSQLRTSLWIRTQANAFSGVFEPPELQRRGTFLSLRASCPSFGSRREQSYANWNSLVPLLGSLILFDADFGRGDRYADVHALVLKGEVP